MDPYPSMQSTPAPADMHPAARDARETVDILLVEDNPTDVELTMRAFRKSGSTGTVHIVNDGAEALDFVFRQGVYSTARHAHPRVIVLDLKLPKIDGHEVLRRIKADPATRTIPVVILTSSAEDRDVARSYEYGVNSYVVKPVEFDAFIEAVSALGVYWQSVNHAPG